MPLPSLEHNDYSAFIPWYTRKISLYVTTSIVVSLYSIPYQLFIPVHNA